MLLTLASVSLEPILFVPLGQTLSRLCVVEAEAGFQERSADGIRAAHYK